MAEYIVNPDEWLSLRKEDINEKNCEPIVRCKDCRWLFRDDEENPKLPDDSDGLWCDVFLIDTIEDGFCAWAKPKE